MRADVQLRRLVRINPLTPEFARATGEVTFVPLECVWPRGQADFTRRAEVENVANGYTRFRKGDVLLPKVTPTFQAGRATVATIDTSLGAASTEVHILRETARSSARYMAYLGQSRRFISEGETVVEGVGNLLRVPTDWVKAFRVPLLSRQRQEAIADFLDRETAQIDAMVDAQEQMLNRVREREEAQTEYWIAEATANQPLVALKHVVDAQPGFAFPSADFGPEREGARLLRGVNIKPSRLDWSDTARWDLPESAAGNHYLLEEGDVVFGMDRPFISEGTRVALIDASSAGSLLVQRVLRLRARRGDSRLVYWLLRSPRLVAHLEPDFTGISVPHVSEAQVLSFLVPSISAETQHTLADRIAIQHEQHMALVVEAERVISLLRERRAALITAAVTGRIDPTTGIERIDPTTEEEAS